jgi:hypothetical protein
VADLQGVINALPDCIAGSAETASFLTSIADQIKSQAAGLDSWVDRWFDFGEATKIYSKDRIIAAANALDLYGKQLQGKGGRYCRASNERNEVIRLLGEAYGLVGARVGVNATLSEAREDLAKDLTKPLPVIGAGIVVVLVALAVILVLVKGK